MMTEEQKVKFDGIIQSIKNNLKQLNEEFGASFIIAISAVVDDSHRSSNIGCSCTNIEAITLFKDLIEDAANLIKPIKIINEYINKIESKND